MARPAEEKLAESTAANRALSAQLENIAPQLTSLEQALTESRRKLKEEQELRRAAEQAQDETDQRLREMEESLQHVREECDFVHEELAFKENELEEARLELEVEKQQLENELKSAKEGMQAAVSRAARPLADDATEDASNAPAAGGGGGGGRSDDSVPSVDDAYVKKLEEELELVTEQLIETENRLSETEGQMQNLQNQVVQLRENEGGRTDDDEELIRKLQTEMADRLESEQQLMEELTLTREELALAKEEIALQQEELIAAEADNKAKTLELEESVIKHKEEVTKLTIQVKEAEVAQKTSLGEAVVVAQTVQKVNEENEDLKQEIQSLEAALKNAKEDYQNVLDELEDVNARFDEACNEARKDGREVAIEETRERMKADVEHEVSTMKSQLQKLSQENSELQQKVDEAEIEIAKVKDSQEQGNRETSQQDEAQSEVVKQLQAQLVRAKEEISKKETEMAAIASNVEDRLKKAEDKASRLESDLHAAKSQLNEAEAHVVVLKREKERLENTTHIPQSPRNKKGPVAFLSAPSGVSLPKAPSLDGAGSSDREELSEMDTAPRILRTSSRERSRSSSPVSVMRLEFRLQEKEKEYSDLEKKYEELEAQKRMGEVRIKRLEEDLRLLQKELFAHGGDTAVVTQMTRLSSLAATTHEKDVDIIIQDTEDEGKRIQDVVASNDVGLLAEEVQSLAKKINGQKEYNAQLLSKMLHLQGNIQVYCRIRPMSFKEMQRGYKEVAESLSETEVGCFDSRTNKWKSFAFDRVWGPDQSQQSVFQDVEPLALSVVDGFNACIFAYGQTGSGKTYTMEGLAENNQYGISYRTIQKIFHLLNLRAQQQRAAEMFVESENPADPAGMEEVAFKFTLELGMLEIYNDEVYDLLTAHNSSVSDKKQEAMRHGGKASLEIRRNAEGRIEVPNLTKEKVHSINEVMELLKRGNSNRATAATDLNEHSSRSHMVLSVDVMSGLGDTMGNKGTLYLVDLAGSERVRKSHVEGAQLKEAGFINKSLSALGNVMEALDRKASHVPYRDSKLTYLLQDSLGGNSRTMMVVTICPMDNSYDESVHALQFATRVRRIQIGAAQRNVTSKNLEETVKSLTEEMRALTRAKERSESQLHSLKRDNARVQDKLKNLSQAKAQSRTDTKTLEVLRKNNDDMAARWQKEKTAKEEASKELDKAHKEQRTLQQQVGKMKTKVDTLERKLEDKERDLENANRRLRQERNTQTATSVRARRDQVLGSRKPTGVSPQVFLPTTPTLTGQSVNTTQAVAAQPSMPAEVNGGEDIASIRAKVLELLEQHDQGKVNRIDIIMEKFKGKEALLLEKMSQRYGGSSPAVSFQKRNEIALQRHQERMKRIREGKKQQNGTGMQ